MGITPIENDKERDVTFYKRRNGLYKGAADLSVLTGARVAIILATENGRIHSFGTPSAKPIVDGLLSGTSPPINEVKEARIARLQRDVAQLDMETTIKDKRNQVSRQHVKKVQVENPGMTANLIFSKEEDLSLEDLYKLFNELSRVHEDSQSQLPIFHHGHEANIGGKGLTRNILPPADLCNDHLQTTHFSQQPSWSHHPPQQLFHPIPLPSPAEQKLAPLHTMNVPQILQTSSSSVVPPFTSSLQQIPDLVNDFAIDGPCGYDLLGYPLLDNVYHNKYPGVDAYLGYNGTKM
jgi:hypothetical protein